MDKGMALLRQSIYLLLALALMSLAGCAMYTPRNELGQFAQPEWINLGVSTDGLVLHELDKTSIQRSGDWMEYIDRHTILDSRHPHRKSYRYINWQMHCAQKTYRAKAIRLYDGSHQLIKEMPYTVNSAPEQPITPNSPSDKQWRIVCGAS